MPHTWSWHFTVFMHRTLRMKALLFVELLRLEVEWRALLDRSKALDLQGHACLLDCLNPGALLALRHLLLAHDPTVLVLDQIGLLQAAHGLFLAPAQHHNLTHSAL